jgi:hypothetical protein
MSYKKTREPLPYLSIDVLSLYLTFSSTMPTVHLVAFVDRPKPILKKPEKGKNTTFLCRRSMIKLSNTGAFLSSLVVFLLSMSQVENLPILASGGVGHSKAARKLDLLNLLLFYAHYRYYLNLSVTELIRY